MAEITTAEVIRTKLREFEERVDSVIAAAKAITRIKTAAESLIASAEDVKAKSESSLQKADGYRLALQQVHDDWAALKKEFEKSQQESQDARGSIWRGLHTAIESLAKKLAEAEERLRASNRAALAEQAELLTRLETSTRSNADLSVTAKKDIEERAEKLNHLLETVRAELDEGTRALRHTITDQLSHARQLLESKVQTSVRELEDQLHRKLAEHQQSIEKQLTDFLNKQNALAQNLTQQLDGFNRASQAASAEFAQTKVQLNELAESIQERALKTDANVQRIVESLKVWIAHVATLQTKLDSHDQAIRAIEAGHAYRAEIALRQWLAEMSARMKEIIRKLRGSRLGRLVGFK